MAEILRPEESGSENAIAVVKKYIADNISLKIQREELAKIVYLNPDYLTKLFRKQMGVTLGEVYFAKAPGAGQTAVIEYKFIDSGYQRAGWNYRCVLFYPYI